MADSGFLVESEIPALVFAYADGLSLANARASCSALAEAAPPTSARWPALLRALKAQIPGLASAMSQVLSIEGAMSRCRLRASPVAADNRESANGALTLLVIGADCASVASVVQLLCFGACHLSPLSSLGGFGVISFVAKHSVAPDVLGELALELGDLVEVINDPDRRVGKQSRWAYGLNVRSSELGWFPMEAISEPSVWTELDGSIVQIRLSSISLDSISFACSSMRNLLLDGRCGCLFVDAGSPSCAEAIPAFERALGPELARSLPVASVRRVKEISPECAEGVSCLGRLATKHKIPEALTDFSNTSGVDTAFALVASKLMVPVSEAGVF